jgi:hypothetical protein
VVLLFPEKEAKSVCSASQKTTNRRSLVFSFFLTPNLREAEPRGLGLAPEEGIVTGHSSFSRKRSKKR